MKKQEKITVAIVEPNKPARIEVIENTLEAKQAIVGGRIEVLVMKVLTLFLMKKANSRI